MKVQFYISKLFYLDSNKLIRYTVKLNKKSLYRVKVDFNHHGLVGKIKLPMAECAN